MVSSLRLSRRVFNIFGRLASQRTGIVFLFVWEIRVCCLVYFSYKQIFWEVLRLSALIIISLLLVTLHFNGLNLVRTRFTWCVWKLGRFVSGVVGKVWDLIIFIEHLLSVVSLEITFGILRLKSHTISMFVIGIKIGVSRINKFGSATLRARFSGECSVEFWLELLEHLLLLVLLISLRHGVDSSYFIVWFSFAYRF